MRLSDAKIKKSYLVEKVLDCFEKNTLEAMGFVSGINLNILASSLLNKTLLINILNSTVAIKKTVLENVIVKEIN